MTLTYPMIDRIEGTFYLKDPELKKPLMKSNFMWAMNTQSNGEPPKTN